MAKQVYKCEYCKFFSESENKVLKHEKSCSENPEIKKMKEWENAVEYLANNKVNFQFDC